MRDLLIEPQTVIGDFCRFLQGIVDTSGSPLIETLRRALEKGEIAGDSAVFAREYIAKTKLAIAHGLVLSGRRWDAIRLVGESRTRLFRRERARCLLMALSLGGKPWRDAT